MSQALPSNQCCQTSCDGTTPVLIPGPQGEKGDPGESCTPCSNGVNAYTTLGAAFTMPAEGANSASTLVGQSTSFVVGQVVFMLGAGWLQVISKADATHMVLKNLKSTSAGTYASNVVAGTVIVNGSPISPAGLQGPTGATGSTGSAGATGAAGSNGSAGTNGKNSFTTTSSNFTQPAVGANVSLAVLDSSWAVVNQIVFVGGGGGYYQVISKANALEMTIQNKGYTGNAVVGATINSGSSVGPGGLQGQQIQSQISLSATAVHTVAVVPFDDSVPQNTEGVQLTTVSITPVNANSKLFIEALVTFSANASDAVILALFQDSTANALSAAFAQCTDNNPNQLALMHEVTAGSTTATTFKIRIGSGTGVGLGINGTDGGVSVTRKLGGVCNVALKVTEVPP